MHSLPKLKYAFNDLEPFYDAKTVEIHYTKHHQTYVDNLNQLLSLAPIHFQEMDLATLMLNLNSLPQDIAIGIRNNGGGHYCHNLFWAQFKKNPNPISGMILEKINESFLSFDAFLEKFKMLAKNNFGSGWTWLVINAQNKLEIINTSGHNTPLELNFKPLMVIDIWEHAYYLKYQNRRVEWIDNFFKILDWDYVNEQLINILNK